MPELVHSQDKSPLERGKLGNLVDYVTPRAKGIEYNLKDDNCEIN